MPELPEVETVRAGLAAHVVGRTVKTARVLHPRAVRRDPAGPAGFEAAMAGRLLERAERRGKYLWLAAGNGEALLAHLGMSGQMLVGDPDRPLSPHVRARFTFEDGGPDLRFTDQRTFGHLMIVELLAPGETNGVSPLANGVSPRQRGGDPPFTPLPKGTSMDRSTEHPLGVPLAGLGTAPPRGEAGVAMVADARAPVEVAGTPALRLLPAPIAHIAPDPLEAAFDAAQFSARLRRRHTGIKRALLDQSLISGVGNIYADEALWRARLHWARSTDTLEPAEVSRLLAAVTGVLTEALRAGGTSFDSLYVNVNGQSGYFERSLEAYGRAGQPCSRCGTPIRRDSFMNRSSYSCPQCQPNGQA
jgi:formamidopyrimidine-DNA glycosylase